MRHVATPARRHEGVALFGLVGIVLLTAAWAYDSVSAPPRPPTPLQAPDAPVPLADPTAATVEPARPTGRIRRADIGGRSHRASVPAQPGDG